MDTSEPVTRVTLFVPGERTLADAVAGEWIENPQDGSFGQSFSMGTIDDALVQQIDAAPGALLVKLTDDLLEGRERVAEVLQRLQDQGALAARLEQSKLGWSVEHWLETLREGNPWALHRTAVTMLTENARVTSCGMHAFSLPEARIELDEKTALDDAQHLLSTLNVYQLAEDPLLLSGQTFSPDADTPRRVLQRWPDDGYPPEHWCHNPYGVWRLGGLAEPQPRGALGLVGQLWRRARQKPEAQSRQQRELHLQFIPSLVAVLTALEQKQGPLTRQQVEETRDSAACMAMDHRDARRIEKSRGYADLDPELAWEQWQVVSANRGIAR